MCDEPDSLSQFHKGQILTEGLILVREDICDWLTSLFNEIVIIGDTFLTSLHTGVLLCDLLQRIYALISLEKLPSHWPREPPIADRRATPASFKANDNVSLFLDWCRSAGLRNTILFETRGLMNSDEEKNVVLALLHLGETCVDLDIPVPQFARFKREIDVDQRTEPCLDSVLSINESNDLESLDTELNSLEILSEEDTNVCNNTTSSPARRPAYTKTNPDKIYQSLVSKISKRCCCEQQFNIEYTAMHSGMYRIGSKNIYVRMFKNHIMLRIGGGWETLDEYLDKVDPCCKNPLIRKSLSNALRMSQDEKLSPTKLRKFSEPELTKIKNIGMNRNSPSPSFR